ncbi:MAG TPA: Ig-like domain repeat protein, partial [Pyrinomonadaceae bacterium]|nr:Ig-like domain repeat protein [Pyrinomonadaceae bacterium]
GTQYALILRPAANPTPGGSGLFWIRSSPSTYANGSRVTSTDSGGTWTADTTRDFNFKAYMQTGFAASGNLISSPRDANPSGGITPIWSTFSWNATVPANTSLKFQLAGANNVNGPFNFVGPDGTAATFFTTSPVQLSPQFYNLRFVEYKALLATTDSTVTPTVNDATACFNDVDCSTTVATITPTPAEVCANTTGNTASGPAGMTAYAWGITNATITSATNTQSITYTAGASGSVTLNLTVTGPNGCIVANSVPVTINPIPATPTITPGGPTTFCAGDSVALTSSNASGNQWYLNGNPIGGATNQMYSATASGNYSVITTASSCGSAASAATTVTVNPLPATPTITPGGPTTFCAGGSVLLTSSSAAGNQWYLNGNPIGGATNQTYSATASGNYTDVVTASGCASAPSAATTVTINPIPATPTITPGGPTTFCAGGSVALTSSSASGNQWYLNGNPIGGATNQAFSATASGSYTDMVTTNGCPSSPSAAVSVTVNPIPATPTITPGGPTTFCAGGSVALTSSSASGNQWYLNGNPIGGATNQAYSATASGNYTDVVTTSGCNSSPSTATTVTVNPIPATPTITPGGPTTFSTGDSVTLTSSSASGNQWLLNGNPIGGATNQSYVATASGDYTVTHTALGCSSAPSATVTVVVIPFFPPTISKLFLPDTVAPDGTTLLSLTISNPNSDPNPNLTLTGISFTDNLPTGLVIALPNELSSDCGGTVTALPGSSSISLSDGTLAPGAPDALHPGKSIPQAPANPAQGTCFITVKVRAPFTLGVLNNTTQPISANETGPGATSNTASLTVVTPPSPPTIAKGFGAASIPLNGVASLTFTFTNPNSNVTLMNISASDTLPAGLVIANPNVLAGSCLADISANPGSNMIAITALTLSPSSSCSFSVNVNGTSAGTKNNISQNVTATYDDGAGNFLPLVGGSAAATIDVLKGNQTIAFGALTNQTFGNADFSVSSTTTSGLTVSFTASGQCTVAGTMVHLTGAGSCTITASQAGDSNYNPATNVVQSFSIAQVVPTATVSSSINPSDIGQNVIFTATITPPSNTSSSTGTVQFKDGANNLGNAVNCVAGGGNTCMAQISTSTLTTGTHAISAVYSGDANVTGSTGTLLGGQVVTNQLALQLILDESGTDPNQAAALDSLLLLRDPFPVHSIAAWLTFGPDRNTRVMVFVANLQLGSGESAAAVVVNLIDSNNQSIDVPAEDVRLNPITGFAQVTFRLPDPLSAGACAVKVKAHGHVSNSATIQIGP